MTKKVSIIIGLLIISIVILGFKLNSEIRKNRLQSTDVEEVTEQDAHKTMEKRIESIVDQAKRGATPGFDGTVGETTVNEVTEQWGMSDKHSEVVTGHYIEFPNQDSTIGILDDIVFDVRYAGKDLTEIHYKDLQNTLGEPDETKTYQDDSHDQIILIHHVSSDYQLKWILPKPTEATPNPSVDHIAVWTKVETKLEKVLSGMSLDEKIGQLIIAGIDGTNINAASNQLIEQYKIGGVIFYAENAETSEQTKAFVNNLKVANQTNQYPLFISIDQEGGRVARLPKQVEKLPTAAVIGKKNDPDYAFNVGRTLGTQLSQSGFNMNFAPVLDVNSNPNNPVIGDRSFSADPEIVSILGVQTMKGIEEQYVIPVVKHFPGHGDTSVDSHIELPKVDKTLKQLEQLELIPFKKAIQVGADVIMVAHILLPQLDNSYPASMSTPIITDLLRHDLGFNGLVITDDMTMKAITNHYGIGEAAVQSIKAGSDIVLVAHHPKQTIAVIEALKVAVTANEITVQRIDESVARVIKLKEKYKLANE